jgi:hypothetical protein
MPVAKSLEVAVTVVTEWSFTVKVVNVSGLLDAPFGVLAIRVAFKVTGPDLFPFRSITAFRCRTSCPIRFDAMLVALRLAGQFRATLDGAWGKVFSSHDSRLSNAKCHRLV